MAIAAALVVAVVIGVAWLSGLLPPVADAIWRSPLVIVGLVAVTVLVLVRALTRAARH